MVTGDSFTVLHRTYRMGISTISKIVNNTCDAIWNILRRESLPKLTKKTLKNIAVGFERKAQFPHCTGAVGGKQFRTAKPADYKSSNSKDLLSILLVAVADSDYRFIFIDVKSYEQERDSYIFQTTDFFQRIEKEKFPLPDPSSLRTSIKESLPYTFVGDDGFALRPNLLRPFTGKPLTDSKAIFNSRLNTATRYVECAYAILSNKWKIFHRPLNVSESLSIKIVQACCILHNFVLKRDGYNFEDSLVVSGFEDIRRAQHNCLRGKQVAEMIRNQFEAYFNSEEGSLS